MGLHLALRWLSEVHRDDDHDQINKPATKYFETQTKEEQFANQANVMF
jgi:hypothetical protein